MTNANMKGLFITLAVIVVAGVGYLISLTAPEQAPNAGPDTEQSASTPSPAAQPSGNTLDLSGQRLTKVPDYVFTRTDIEVLDLSDNRLTGALQAEVRHL